MKRAAATVLVGVLLVAGFAGSSGAAETGKKLFGEKCILCHPLDRALSQHRNREGWAKTVARMRQVNHCPVTEAEAKAIVDYLAKVRGPAAR